jgi:hypothetical protein
VYLRSATGACARSRFLFLANQALERERSYDFSLPIRRVTGVIERWWG